jgi:tetratricopeptide (TPR) repeat protein
VTYAKDLEPGLYSTSLDRLSKAQEIVFLPNAVPPLAGDQAPDAIMYGWVRGLVPSPSPYDIYLVRFYREEAGSCGAPGESGGTSREATRGTSRGESRASGATRASRASRGAYRGATGASCGAYQFRILAYVDRYARVFGTSVPFIVPPARYPDLDFAAYRTSDGTRESGRGCVRVYDAKGKTSVYAQYRCDEGRYSLCNSWFRFGVNGQDLSLNEALARAYFALVFRPFKMRRALPMSGLASLESRIRGRDAIRVLRRVSRFLANAEEDDALQAPSPARFLFKWIHEAGLAQAWRITEACGGSGVALSRTEYSSQYCLSMDDDSPLDERTVWKLESALNRYDMMVRYLGADADLSDMARCNKVDLLLRRKFPLQPGFAKVEVDAEADQGEWGVRVGIARALEELLAPYRFTASFRVDVEAGVVAFDLLVPDADMMLDSLWVCTDGGGRWVKQPTSLREHAAIEYAQRLGLALAAIAARQSGRIRTVTITAEWFCEAEQENLADYAYSVVIDCDTLRVPGIYQAAVTDPGSFFAGLVRLNEELSKADLSLDPLEEPDPFWMVTSKSSYSSRFDVPDLAPRIYALDSAYALGCKTSAGLAIDYNAPQRNMAEQVAETLGGLGSVSEAIAALRKVQADSNDPNVLQACTHLMTQLAQGDLRMGDQNQVVASFLGEDRFAVALRRYRAAKLADDEKADEYLADMSRLVDETMAAGVFADDDDTVYRVFDSSTSRIIYNLVQTGVLRVRGLTERVILDNGKTVELAPDSYYHCCVELVRGLEQRFDRSDDALRYGLECVRLSPTVPLGYRQLARAYMLVGDVARGRDLLVSALRFAVGRAEISWLYYQLAYVEWKSSSVLAAQACYLKAIVENPEIIEVAANELRELLGTENTGIMNAQDVEPTLLAFGIPLAPTDGIMDAIQRASRAAVEEGAFLAARNVLSVQLHHRPDNVLVYVLRSLER